MAETPASELENTTNERFRLLVESVKDYAIFLLDPAGVVSSWTEGAERIKGYAANEIIGKHFSIFYPPQDVAAGKCDMELKVALRDGRFEDYGWRVRKDGSQFWANVVITALRDASGRHVGFAKVTRDLTDRAYRAFVEATNAIVWTADRDGKTNADSPSWRAFTGQTQEEWMGQGGWDPVHPDDLVQTSAKWEAAKAQKRNFEAEFRLRRHDGQYVWMASRALPFLNPDGTTREWFGVTFDISSRKAAETRAQEALEQAEIANRAKDDFLATVSHELRNPLQAILGWSKLLLQRDLPPDVRKPLLTIERNARAQARLIEDVLDVSRIISGNLRLELGRASVANAIADALEAARPTAEAKEVTLVSHVEPGTEVHADQIRLQQIVSNLVSNAVKFTPNGGRISVGAESVGSTVRITVHDTGEGIDPALLNVIFEPFRQADGTSTRRHGGLGLGLAIVRQLVLAHGGTVRAESEGKGCGSTFIIEFPARLSARPNDVAGDEPAPLSPRLPGTRVLIVDDQVDALDMIHDALTGAGAVVELAQSAGEGLEKLLDFHPDVLVSDIGMPELDGYGFIRRVRMLGTTSGGRTPAVALTAYAGGEDAELCFAAGFQNHVAKPVDPEHLVRVVANLAGLPVPR